MSSIQSVNVWQHSLLLDSKIIDVYLYVDLFYLFVSKQCVEKLHISISGFAFLETDKLFLSLLRQNQIDLNIENGR